jgi:hypothetical protein
MKVARRGNFAVSDDNNIAPVASAARRRNRQGEICKIAADAICGVILANAIVRPAITFETLGLSKCAGLIDEALDQPCRCGTWRFVDAMQGTERI